MHAGALRALEFDRIVEAVRRFGQTPPGLARLARLAPLIEPREVASALDATAETVRFLAESPIGLRAPDDLDASLAALTVEGRALDPRQLLALADFLASVEATAAAVRRARGTYPILRAIATAAASFEPEIADIRRKIDPAGEVVDDASPELRSIRERLRKQRSRLRNTLESYLRGKDTSKYLQQQIVTDRNGRYVLVVRAEHRASIPGIVHGSSGSGASLFLEPLSTVEINNEIVALEQQEAEEVHRILLALTDTLRRRGDDVERTVGAATEFDVLQARASFSTLVNGVRPAVATDGRLELRAARHPLLIPALQRHLGAGSGSRAGSSDAARAGLRASAEAPAVSRRGAPESEAREGGKAGPYTGDEGELRSEPLASGEPGPPPTAAREPVPVDVVLIPPVTVLVITGPNTGGKTVALKTAGLLSLVAQAGLLVPAAGGTQLPVFRSVFADIGDEQSIAESLSTFSGHIANVVEMERALTLPALVLLDEAGAGTDPVEGGALAMAIIEHFRVRGATVIATTHYDSLKSYASTTDGVVPAGFGFDPKTFAPTYRLNYGSPGSSLAFEIATRLGLPGSIIERARAHRTERESQLAEHLAKVQKDVQMLEHERRLLARERETVTESASKLQAREHDLRNREETFKKRLDERIEERMRDARRQIDSVVDALKGRTGVLAADAERRAARLVPTGALGAARSDARAAVDAIGDRLRTGAGVPGGGQTATTKTTQDRPAAVGDRVLVGAFGLEGIVKALHDREAEVDVRGKRLRARVDELRVLATGSDSGSQPARVRVNVDLRPREGSLTELNLIGCTVDEALSRTEKFLDNTLVSELRSVRLIHGYGTGQLRRAIAGYLQTLPFVANFSPAPPEQGGGGVTVVELKE